jgi:hypothetical protein
MQKVREEMVKISLNPAEAIRLLGPDARRRQTAKVVADLNYCAVMDERLTRRADKASVVFEVPAQSTNNFKFTPVVIARIGRNREPRQMGPHPFPDPHMRPPGATPTMTVND